MEGGVRPESTGGLGLRVAIRNEATHGHGVEERRQHIGGEARPFLAPVGKPRSVRIRIPAAGSSPDGVTTRARACPAAGRKFPVGHLEEGAVGACLRDAGIAEEVAR